jgi:hypothetical protein
VRLEEKFYKGFNIMSEGKLVDLKTEIIVIPDLVPKSLQDQIEDEMTSLRFPWYYKHSVSGYPSDPEVFKNDPNIKVRDALIHLFYADDVEYVSKQFELLKSLTYFLEDKTGIIIEHLIRMRAVLTYRDPSWNQEDYLTPHVDQFGPHMTMIYYVNDCDGPTHFYEDILDPDNENFNKRTLKASYTPKKGTGVVFNGLRYHSNGVGNHKNRVVINMNFIPNLNYIRKPPGEFI